MPISLVQQGILAEFLFNVLAVFGSDGLLEVARQATDDDRRDADVHRRGDFSLNLGFQIKSALQVAHPWTADLLHIRFTVLKDRLVTHPNFWYFFAYMDPRIMRFADPVFIVPSAEIHKHAIPHLQATPGISTFTPASGRMPTIAGSPTASILSRSPKGSLPSSPTSNETRPRDYLPPPSPQRLWVGA